MLVEEAALQLGHQEGALGTAWVAGGDRLGDRRASGRPQARHWLVSWRPPGGVLLAASTSFSTRPLLASVSTDSQSLTRKKVLRAPAGPGQ